MLSELTLDGNPLANAPDHRQSTIFHIRHLRTLDQRQITVCVLMWYELSICVVSLVGHCVWDVDSLPLSLLELLHSRVTTFVLCSQEEERREAVAVAREEEERAKELQKLARLQVKLSSFPDSPEQDHGLRLLKISMHRSPPTQDQKAVAIAAIRKSWEATHQLA